jgi:hypothetical protein
LIFGRSFSYLGIPNLLRYIYSTWYFSLMRIHEQVFQQLR